MRLTCLRILSLVSIRTYGETAFLRGCGQGNALRPSRSFRIGGSAFEFPQFSSFYNNGLEKEVKAQLRFARKERVSEVAEGRAAGIEVVVNRARSEEHTSELQSLRHLVCRL